MIVREDLEYKWPARKDWNIIFYDSLECLVNVKCIYYKKFEYAINHKLKMLMYSLATGQTEVSMGNDVVGDHGVWSRALQLFESDSRPTDVMPWAGSLLYKTCWGEVHHQSWLSAEDNTMLQKVFIPKRYVRDVLFYVFKRNPLYLSDLINTSCTEKLFSIYYWWL